MKRLFFRITKPLAFKKAKHIGNIRLEKRKRIIDAIRFIHQWDSIMPIEWMYNSVCEKLKIEQNDFAKEFINELAQPSVDIDKIATKLP